MQNANAVAWLEPRGVVVTRVRLSKRGQKGHQPFMHHKFAVIDGDYVMTGSLNWTWMGLERNHENVVIASDYTLVKGLMDCFKELWFKWGGDLQQLAMPEPTLSGTRGSSPPSSQRCDNA
jgi:phosphatidylserine/phosphatidylglycerophosphate/cardiolipin synthase-like enzyme